MENTLSRINELTQKQFGDVTVIQPVKYNGSFQRECQQCENFVSCSCSASCGSNYSRNGNCSCLSSCGSNYSR